MRKIKIIIVLLSLGLCVNAQNLKYESIKLSENPKIHKLDSIDIKNKSAIVIQHNEYIQIQNKLTEPYTFFTTHKIVRIIDDVGIGMFNEIYISLDDDDELTDIQVVTIDSNEVPHKFDKTNLKEIKNFEGNGKYKIFAIEGIQKGGEIEYTFTVRKSLMASGREMFQTTVPILQANFEILYPSDFKYSTKSYNGFPQSVDIENGKRITAKNIPAASKERESAYKASLMRVDYRLESTPSKKQALRWSRIAEHMFYSYYVFEDDDAARQLVKSLDLKNKTDVEKLVAIENEIKKNYSIAYSNNDDYFDVSKVYKTKVGNTVGLTRLYIKCLEELKINFFMCFTNSRYNITFDPDFAKSSDLRNVLIYFPELEKYWNPTYIDMRLGQAPAEISGNMGLYVRIKKSPYEANKIFYKDYYIGRVKNLNPEKNKSGFEAKISFDDDLNIANISQTNFYQAQAAYSLRYEYNFADEKQKQELQHSIIGNSIEDIEISSFNVKNEDIKLSSEIDSIFYCKSNYTSNSFIEKLVNELLISVGKLHGKQLEITDNTDRNTDIVFPFVKKQEKTIVIDIPQNYVCKNVEKLNVKYQIIDNEKLLMQFESKCEIAGNQIIIKTTESNEVLNIDVKYYDEYLKIINSINDFGNSVIVLEKK